jgi:hypothetical protein
MNRGDTLLPEMSLQELFASARAVASATELVSLTMSFQLVGPSMDCGRLNVVRNPTSLHWLTTFEVTLDKRTFEHYAHGESPCAALDKMEQHVCRWLA